MSHIPVDNFGTVVGENPSCYGILPLWAVNGLSIVCWDVNQNSGGKFKLDLHVTPEFGLLEKGCVLAV